MKAAIELTEKCEKIRCRRLEGCESIDLLDAPGKNIIEVSLSDRGQVRELNFQKLSGGNIMKNTLFAKIAGSLLILFFLSVPALSAEASETAHELEIQNSKHIEHTVTSPGNIVPSNTYYYNSRGWSGILTRDYYYYDGSETRAFYSGTVRCSGQCPLNHEAASE